MDHVASVPSATSGRMRPEAVALAALLHVAAAVALWWLAMHAPTIQPEVDPIEVTIEQERPKPPPPPPPPPPQQVQPKPLPPPPPEGIKPPAEREADKATSVRPSGEAPKDVAAPPAASLEEAVPQPPKPPAPPTETAMVAPNAAPSPVPPVDRPFLQPLPRPTPGPTIEPLPPPPSPPIQKTPPAQANPQPQRPVPPPPSAGLHRQPSPLVAPRPPSEPPAVARHQDTPTAPSSPFVNPADEHARATAEQNYLWQVIRKLRGYRYHADVPLQEGLTVVMVTIARDGRLIDAEVVRSSGLPVMDQGVLNGIRQGAPYAPLPESLSGSSARFRLPLVSVPEEQ